MIRRMRPGGPAPLPSVDAPPDFGTFTRARVERSIQIVGGIGSLVMAIQSILTALIAPHQVQPGWRELLAILTFLPFALMLIAIASGRFVRIASAGFALSYLIALVLWPWVALPGAASPAADPWIYFMVNVSTVAAVLAFPRPGQVAVGLLAPLLYGLGRTLTGGSDTRFEIAAALSVSFTLILGGVLITLGWIFRTSADRIDHVRRDAVASAARVAAADAAERERVELAALMHDSVLAALIAVERAQTPRERTLAVSMAQDALTRLANTGSEGAGTVGEPGSSADVAAAIERAAESGGITIPVALSGDATATVLPPEVFRGISLAAAQAVRNAVAHAHGRGLRAEVRAEKPARVKVTIFDSGPGFHPDQVPPERLGVKASIIARMASIGGHAGVRSTPAGTTITLEWEGKP